MNEQNASTADAVDLATELTIAWLGNSNTRATAEDVPAFLNRMHEALLTLRAPVDSEPAEPTVEHAPAVSVRKSLASRDHIISMIDGKPYKTLTRHLSSHGLDAKSYRERFGLKPDYPMTAPAYSDARRAMARKIGLGRKPGQSPRKPAPASAVASKAPAKRGRKPAAKSST